MSHDPFDGVLLDDPRPAVPGAVGMALHLRVARRQAKARGWNGPTLGALRARSQACRELMAHGLFPGTVRGLRAFGLDLGSPGAPHSLASLLNHLEAYLTEVAQAGYLEPDAALWRAVDRELDGRRGLWIERSPADGPLRAGLRDLAPTRLRALACVPGLDGASFALATNRGASGLFGSGQPLVDWFLDGLEAHGHRLPNDLALEEPEGWGDTPWASALEALFEEPLPLGDRREDFQRGLVEGPWDLLRHAVEQVCAWLDAGLAPQEITIVHPEPQAAGPLLAPLLAEEGVEIQVNGGPAPLLASGTWSPLWSLLTGLQRLDPCLASAGLRASRREDLRHWADFLAASDQDGTRAFQDSLSHLGDRARAYAEGVWRDLETLRGSRLPAVQWTERLESLVAVLRLPAEAEDFFAPLGLLREVWGAERWTFAEMLPALEAFLEAARSPEAVRAAGGIRLVSPDTLLDGWSGSRATLLLDLSEGAWPARAVDNPDLDGDRKAAINQALVALTRTGEEAVFPAALQRFWLPRSEHGDQIPRAFQREAYAFNKVLALTRERFVALSPGQDTEGRARAQGPFWNALEGAPAWTPDPARIHSRLRWRWEGREVDEGLDARAAAALARPPADGLAVGAPETDHNPGLRQTWLKGRACASPTALEGLARCPFRSVAERAWGLQTFDARSRMSMAVGVLVHHVMETSLVPFVGRRDWPAAFQEALGLDSCAGAEDLLPHLQALWAANQAAWLTGLDPLVPREQQPRAALELESLLPSLAAALLAEVRAEGPTKWELALIAPETLPPAEAARTRTVPLRGGWTRTLLALEGTLGPLELELGNGRTLAVDGKVDRLERWEHECGLAFLRVTDYKASKEARLRAFAEDEAPFGSHLQTPLYMLLAEAANPGLPATAALVPLREEEPKPFTGHLGVLAEAGPGGAWRARLRDNLARLDARLEAGDFPPTPGEHCGQCQLGAVCGRPVDVAVDGEED